MDSTPYTKIKMYAGWGHATFEVGKSLNRLVTDISKGVKKDMGIGDVGDMAAEIEDYNDLEKIRINVGRL